MKSLNKLSICLLISFIGLAVSTSKPECKSQSEELITHSNPNHFWYCHHQGSDAIELPCPEGRGFLRTADQSGCIPYTDWKCTAKKQPSCDNNIKLHRHSNPNKFWVCPEPQGTPAIEYNCPKDRGFVATAEQYGCVPFDIWVCDKAGDNSRE